MTPYQLHRFARFIALGSLAIVAAAAVRALLSGGL